MQTFAPISVILSAIIAAPALAATFAITDVDVIPMDEERLIPNQTVLIEDGVITAIVDSAGFVLPEDTAQIDGTGRYLIPGLAEMHAHIPSDSGESRDRVLDLFVANGVTTLRGMLGHPSHLQLRADAASGSVLAPRVYTSGPSLNGNSVSSPDEARRMVREQAEAGYDFVKIHPGLTLEEFDAMAATANEIGMPFGGHVSIWVGVPRVLAAGQAAIDHLDGYIQALLPDGIEPGVEAQGFFAVGLAGAAEQERIPDLAGATAEAGTWNVATQALLEHVLDETDAEVLAGRPEMRYMPADTLERWKQAKRGVFTDEFTPAMAARAIRLRRDLILALHEAGAGLLLGSDAPQIFNVPGFSTHQELGYLVASGLTPYEALRTGTANPAIFFDASDRFGTVAVGREADLILLASNPLQDIGATRQIVGVMLRGQWLDRGELDRLLARWEP